jgi:hypothetical protein
LTTARVGDARVIVSTRFQDLKDLAQMLDEGKVSQGEYETVKAELLAASSDDWSEADAGVNGLSLNGHASIDAEASDELPEENSEGSETTTDLPDWVNEIVSAPRLYRIAGGAAALTFLIGGAVDPLGWLAAFLGGLALATTRTPRARWMAWSALALGLGFGIVGLFNIGRPAPVDTTNLSVTQNQGAIEEPPADSLGVRFEDLTERWNAMDAPPLILKGISITPESGPFDSFIHRFDNNALVAGAYDPDDGYVYALMVRANLGHPSVSNMYTHLCYLLYPGTQDCFDTFIEESGLFGEDLGDMADVEQTSEWSFDGNEWQLAIDNNVETIRVLAPRGP